MKVGLALSGGGARGYAHLGVLRELERHSVPIDLIAGTSAGSFAGGAYATGLSVDEIIAFGSKLSWFAIAGFSYSPRGLLSNAGLAAFIERNFPVRRFEDLAIPFAAVTCDLETGDEVVLSGRGDLAQAIRASCAVPGVFSPVAADGGRLLIDGGVITPTPAQTVREMGADVVIAVDLMACGATFHGVPRTLVGTLFQSAMTLLRAASRAQHYHADVIIQPAIAHIRPDEIRKREELIELGERAAREKIGEIMQQLGGAKR
ncbi:MAG: patatin-like phospholipase family protein [Pyrinomonadaceae bacterium]